MRRIGLLLVFMVGVAGDAAARINVTSLPGRDSTQLTIYNSVDLTLVTERRTLTFRKGLNRLEFSWANTLIDPTSVEFKAGTHADAIEVIDVSFPPRVANTLEWRIQSEFSGEAVVEIRYFTSGISLGGRLRGASHSARECDATGRQRAHLEPKRRGLR
jgi:hypothetical protein